MMLPIGGDNYVSVDKIVSILDVAIEKVQEQVRIKEEEGLVTVVGEEKSAIFLDDGTVVICGIYPRYLKGRLDKIKEENSLEG